eukprot:gnl/Trimastix_PCT/1015.p1 GENE.gnl/Trimastix_PCT/1015~~gnl/Trimastix_PCT/1015.p1  ORF type:complete len:1415 (+),score=300.87 gnl/Trimastix_PCT/1015:156-4400(+)
MRAPSGTGTAEDGSTVAPTTGPEGTDTTRPACTPPDGRMSAALVGRPRATTITVGAIFAARRPPAGTIAPHGSPLGHARTPRCSSRASLLPHGGSTASVAADPPARSASGPFLQDARPNPLTHRLRWLAAARPFSPRRPTLLRSTLVSVPTAGSLHLSGLRRRHHSSCQWDPRTPSGTERRHSSLPEGAPGRTQASLSLSSHSALGHLLSRIAGLHKAGTHQSGLPDAGHTQGAVLFFSGSFSRFLADWPQPRRSVQNGGAFLMQMEDAFYKTLAFLQSKNLLRTITSLAEELGISVYPNASLTAPHEQQFQEAPSLEMHTSSYREEVNEEDTESSSDEDHDPVFEQFSATFVDAMIDQVLDELALEEDTSVSDDESCTSSGDVDEENTSDGEISVPPLPPCLASPGWDDPLPADEWSDDDDIGITRVVVPPALDDIPRSNVEATPPAFRAGGEAGADGDADEEEDDDEDSSTHTDSESASIATSSSAGERDGDGSCCSTDAQTPGDAPRDDAYRHPLDYNNAAPASGKLLPLFELAKDMPFDEFVRVYKQQQQQAACTAEDSASTSASVEEDPAPADTPHTEPPPSHGSPLCVSPAPLSADALSGSDATPSHTSPAPGPGRASQAQRSSEQAPPRRRGSREIGHSTENGPAIEIIPNTASPPPCEDSEQHASAGRGGRLHASHEFRGWIDREEGRLRSQAASMGHAVALPAPGQEASLLPLQSPAVPGPLVTKAPLPPPAAVHEQLFSLGARPDAPGAEAQPETEADEAAHREMPPPTLRRPKDESAPHAPAPPPPRSITITPPRAAPPVHHVVTPLSPMRRGPAPPQVMVTPPRCRGGGPAPLPEGRITLDLDISSGVAAEDERCAEVPTAPCGHTPPRKAAALVERPVLRKRTPTHARRLSGTVTPPPPPRSAPTSARRTRPPEPEESDSDSDSTCSCATACRESDACESTDTEIVAITHRAQLPPEEHGDAIEPYAHTIPASVVLQAESDPCLFASPACPLGQPPLVGPAGKEQEAAFGASSPYATPPPGSQSHTHTVTHTPVLATPPLPAPAPAPDTEPLCTMNLKIFCHPARTGFEESKDFSVVLHSVIAGRYQILEYLGSAAFSKAVQCLDLQTQQLVCVKIIKNNKDFFDQSLDEIKLLQYTNAHDPDDQFHIVRMYDFFYYKEHLFIVCELLRDNLYEFQRFNREAGNENYFTIPRLQKIARQVLESLAFLHRLNLIHCDLKPENILIRSYSRCLVKVIDLGSSCFTTDHLSLYVQSRSYRAPEVILGLPYGQKIDLWSLGCIMAELHTGRVLFLNDSLQTLLGRIIGIVGRIPQHMLDTGRYVSRYFTPSSTLYERTQNEHGNETLYYLLPKKTTLQHRLHTQDTAFVDFVQRLLTIDPDKRPSALEALQHPWFQVAYPDAPPP